MESNFNLDNALRIISNQVKGGPLQKLVLLEPVVFILQPQGFTV